MVLSALYYYYYLKQLSWDCDLASSITMTVIFRAVPFKEGFTRYMTFNITLFSCCLYVYLTSLTLSLHWSQTLAQMTISKMPLCPKL